MKEVFWGQTEKPIMIKVECLRQSQPGTWKIHIKQDAEELINLLLPLVEFTKFPFFTQAHPLQKQVVKNSFFCQSLTLRTGQSSLRRPETS